MPFSLLKISQALRGIEPGDSLEVLWSDPETPMDLFKVLPPNAYKMVGMGRVEEKNPYFRLLLLKRPVAGCAEEDGGVSNAGLLPGREGSAGKTAKNPNCQ